MSTSHPLKQYGSGNPLLCKVKRRWWPSPSYFTGWEIDMPASLYNRKQYTHVRIKYHDHLVVQR